VRSVDKLDRLSLSENIIEKCKEISLKCCGKLKNPFRSDKVLKKINYFDLNISSGSPFFRIYCNNGFAKLDNNSIFFIRVKSIYL
jgi:hypothetical protein